MEHPHEQAPVGAASLYWNSMRYRHRIEAFSKGLDGAFQLQTMHGTDKPCVPEKPQAIV